MNVFLYKKKLFLNDKIAKKLQISLIKPYISCYKNAKGNILICSTNIGFKNAIFLGYMECTLLKEGWSLTLTLPFPWEKEYYFKHLYSSIYILQNNPISTKEVITDEFPKTKTLSRRRCQQTKRIQNVWYSESTTNGQNPDIIDTLR